MRYSQLLNELKIIGNNLDDDGYDGNDIVFNNFDGNIFIGDRDELTELINDTYDMDIYDIDDLVSDGPLDHEDGRYFMIGEISDGMLLMNDYDIEGEISSQLNTQVQKIVKQLDLHGIEYNSTSTSDGGEAEEEIQHTVSRMDVIDANVNTTTFYHGTDYSKLKSILGKGLIGQKASNFTKIAHESKTFFTTKLSKAAQHAIISSENANSVPVILKISLPDKSKLVLDYDVAMSHYGIDHPLTMALGYDEIYHNASGMMNLVKKDKSTVDEWEKLADKSSLNTKIGIFGYAGRIPPHINGFFVDEQSVAFVTYFEDDMELSEFKPKAQMLKDGLDHTYKSYKELMSDVKEIIESEYEEEEYDED